RGMAQAVMKFAAVLRAVCTLGVGRALTERPLQVRRRGGGGGGGGEEEIQDALDRAGARPHAGTGRGSLAPSRGPAVGLPGAQATPPRGESPRGSATASQA
ncbi:unnamed protein product, partial [Prorocentrum cordatum]